MAKATKKNSGKKRTAKRKITAGFAKDPFEAAAEVEAAGQRGAVCTCPGPAGSIHESDCPAYLPLEAAAATMASPTVEPVVIVNLTTSVCPFCHSPKRDPYHGTSEIRGPVRVLGVTYASITLKRTKCSDCGRRRIDRFRNPMPVDSPGSVV